MNKLKFKAEFAAHHGAVYTFCSGPDENHFFSAGSDRNVLLWDLKNSNNPNLVAKSPSIVLSLQYIPNKDLLLIGQAEGGIHVISLKEKKEIHYLKAQSNYLFKMLYIEEKEELISAAGDGTIAVWSLNTFDKLWQKEFSKKKLRALAFNRERDEICLGTGEGKLYFLNAKDYSIKTEMEAFRSSINALCYWDEHRLIIGEKDAYLTEVDVDTFKQIQELPAHNWAIYDMVMLPGLNRLITASRDKTIKLWDSTSLQVLQRLEGRAMQAHSHSVNCLLWNEANQCLMSSGDDGKIKQWVLA